MIIRSREEGHLTLCCTELHRLSFTPCCHIFTDVCNRNAPCFFQDDGFGTLPYADRLRRLNVPSLELWRLHTDLIYCHKIVFGLTDLPLSDYFQVAPLLNTRGHKFKLHKKRWSAIVCSKFFSERVVNTWNNLPSSVDFSSLSSFIRTVKLTDLSDYLRCF